MRLVAPFAAGGSSDAFGRDLAPKLAARLRQNVIVENRPDAGGMVGGQPTIALFGRQIDLVFATITVAMPHMQTNRVRSLAMAAKEPSSRLPGVPTTHQMLPEFSVTSFSGIGRPRGIPRPVVDRLNREIRAVLVTLRR